MTAEVQRLRDEQIALATLLLAGHPEQFGLRMAISDAFSEEMILAYPEIWKGPDCNPIKAVSRQTA